MNIVIDHGNQAFKVGLFEEKMLLKTFRVAIARSKWLYSILRTYQPQKGIGCNTGKKKMSLWSLLKKEIPCFYELTSYLPLPLQINYQTPQTLGADRLAAAVGAWTQQPHNNLLIIDIGTAITIDFVSYKGVYHGGNISAGISMRLHALNDFAYYLPQVKEKGPIPLLGYNTETAIRSGVIEGIVHELKSYLEEYIKTKQVIPFLTGGNSTFFKKKLKNTAFTDEHLVLKGLNEILIYQNSKNLKK